MEDPLKNQNPENQQFQQMNNNVNVNVNVDVVLNTSDEHTSANVSIDETAKIVHDKRENKKILFIGLISVICAIILIVALFLVFGHLNKMNEYTHNEEYPLYQYFAGQKNTYTGKVTISKNKDITEIKNDDGVVGIEDAPIYFQKNDDEVLVSKNMLLVFPRINNKNYKIKLFTKLTYDKDSDSSFYYNGKEKIFLEESFLYDGHDLYLFLYKTTVQVGEKTYELSPLSYAIVDYHDEVQIYDKEKDKYEIIENCDFDIIATLGEHKINLSTDMVDNNRLLIKSIDNLPLYKK